MKKNELYSWDASLCNIKKFYYHVIFDVRLRNVFYFAAEISGSPMILFFDYRTLIHFPWNTKRSYIFSDPDICDTSFVFAARRWITLYLSRFPRTNERTNYLLAIDLSPRAFHSLPPPFTHRKHEPRNLLNFFFSYRYRIVRTDGDLIVAWLIPINMHSCLFRWPKVTLLVRSQNPSLSLNSIPFYEQAPSFADISHDAGPCSRTRVVHPRVDAYPALSPGTWRGVFAGALPAPRAWSDYA